MATKTLTIQIQIAWWFRYGYLPAVFIAMHVVALATGEIPTLGERFDYWAKKAISAKRVK